MNTKGSSIRLYGALLAILLLAATPASAQFEPQKLNDPATGEKFHIEGGFGGWSPTAQMVISSESLGIVGSSVDFKKDLGMEDSRFREFHLVARPARKHKFRFQFIPILFNQDGHLITREITFNGQKYPVSSVVNSVLDWKAYRFGYEYDFVARNRGFAGFILDAKYTDVSASLKVALPFVDEFIRAQAPIPTIGGIGRFYIVPNISITGELTGIDIPDSVSKVYKAHYAEFDTYGTVNFTNNVGAQVGYRSVNVGYHVNKDTGSFILKGLYFGVVARY